MAVFRWIDNAACGVFLIDVMVRWRRAGWTSEFWRWGWVDLLAAIPFDAAFRTLQIIRVYRIIRFRFHGRPRTLRNHVTLSEAQAHCGREDTSSHSTGPGAWFDGHDYMPGCRPLED